MESEIELPKGMRVKIASKIDGVATRHSNQTVTVKCRIENSQIPGDWYYVEENNLAWNVSELTPV